MLPFRLTFGQSAQDTRHLRPAWKNGESSPPGFTFTTPTRHIDNNLPACWDGSPAHRSTAWQCSLPKE
ncbi:hypothetical protein MAPG_07127 [Magnaporthiopsis poae ATCC 64411]|uniref:Uncharacterized protein n=1 Tax=Magnaporthiopsis poae (strain ATCC 64411 / 73-15) TaxID=644358 RepID=A0A0C4E3V2_MAGP6|nr:hypothetical protein MAPG_07127 [Magnaporthiopsis poae ATCC 64411]